jgi:hypothetical protein
MYLHYFFSLVLDMWRILIIDSHPISYISSLSNKWIDLLLNSADMSQFHAINRMLFFRIVCNMFYHEKTRSLILNNLEKVFILFL